MHDKAKVSSLPQTLRRALYGPALAVRRFTEGRNRLMRAGRNGAQLLSIDNIPQPVSLRLQPVSRCLILFPPAFPVSLGLFPALTDISFPSNLLHAFLSTSLAAFPNILVCTDRQTDSQEKANNAFQLFWKHAFKGQSGKPGDWPLVVLGLASPTSESRGSVFLRDHLSLFTLGMPAGEMSCCPRLEAGDLMPRGRALS